ncbi:MAG: type II CAAX endopeptidase family protein [Planctomycetota bacterium]
MAGLTDPHEMICESITLRLSRAKGATLIGFVLVTQIAFWFFGAPGPQLFHERNLPNAQISCCFAVLLLAVIPAIVWVGLAGQRLESSGLRFGDAKMGLKILACCMPIMLLGTWIGTRNPQIRAYYPVPGDSIVNTNRDILIWFAFYLAYYIAYEWFYRCFLVKSLRLATGLDIWPAILIQAFFCCFVHIGKPNMELIASFPASILFGWIAWRTKSIWYGVILHFGIGIVNDLGSIH